MRLGHVVSFVNFSGMFENDSCSSASLLSSSVTASLGDMPNIPNLSQSETETNKVPPEEAMQQLELLPDHARRSRHTAIFPFIIRHPDGSSLLLAADRGSVMWEWAFIIRWRGQFPFDVLGKGRFCEMMGCSTVRTHPHPLWVCSATLQETLLHHLLLYTPYVKKKGRSLFTRDFDVQRTLIETSWLPNFTPPLGNPGTLTDQCGLSDALIGACIHGSEKNVELLLSLGLPRTSLPFSLSPTLYRTYLFPRITR